jgi:hypothetical protein
MKMLRILTLLTTSFAFTAFAAEEATVKITPNSPVSYFAKIDVEAKQKTASGLVLRGTGNFASNFDLNVDTHDTPPELLFIFHRINFNFDVGGLTINYDTKKALSGNPIPVERDALAQILGKAYKMPLTTDPDYTPNGSDPYVIAPPTDPAIRQHFDEAVKEILQALKGGVHFTVGETKEQNKETENGNISNKMIVSMIDNDKVVLDNHLDINMKWEEPKENGGGGIAISGKGEIKKTINRSNMLLSHAKGSITLNISEIPGEQGKQMLHDGDLVMLINVDVTSQKEGGSRQEKQK